MNTPDNEKLMIAELNLNILRRAMEQIWSVLERGDVDYQTMIEIEYIYKECKKARGK